MQHLYRSGRYLFACSILAFGIIQLVAGHFLIGLLPFSGSIAENKIFLYLISAMLIGGGVGMFIPSFLRRAALATGFLLLALFIFPHLIKLLGDIHDGGIWTGAAEMLAMSGGAWIIAGDPVYPAILSASETSFTQWSAIGHWQFAIPQVIFAALHFLYADYIATLIPAWIPFPLFWAYFVGLAFLLTGFSIIIKTKTRLTCTLLGFMFLFWVIFLHAPRIVQNPNTEAEWTSGFVALAFSGIFFSLAGQFSFGKKLSISPHVR